MKRPTTEMSKLMLNALLLFECLPTITTAKPEATADNRASVIPSIFFCLYARVIKANHMG